MKQYSEWLLDLQRMVWRYYDECTTFEEQAEHHSSNVEHALDSATDSVTVAVSFTLKIPGFARAGRDIIWVRRVLHKVVGKGLRTILGNRAQDFSFAIHPTPEVHDAYVVRLHTRIMHYLYEQRWLNPNRPLSELMVSAGKMALHDIIQQDAPDTGAEEQTTKPPGDGRQLH